MTKEELALKLDGRGYQCEIDYKEEQQAEKDGLVVVLGESDDLMKFCGAIYGESGCYEGGTAYLDDSGLLKNECEDEYCPYYRNLKQNAKSVEAVWSDENGTPSWRYKTDIPHSTFKIIEDGSIYCLGIVFSINDLK